MTAYARLQAYWHARAHMRRPGPVTLSVGDELIHHTCCWGEIYLQHGIIGVAVSLGH